VTVRVGDGVTVEVRDDGRGIAQGSRSSGLRNMAERAEGRGGEFTVRRGPGSGTVLTWSVPGR
jgi:two-component system, NarL family, sensor histidine kinase DevS